MSRHSSDVKRRQVLGRLVLCSLGFLPLAAGCVRRYHRDYGHRVNLTMARGPTATKISWNSVQGQPYTLMYREANAGPNTKWVYHPKAINVMGTGGVMSFVDQHPQGSMRRYRLELKPVTGKPVK